MSFSPVPVRKPKKEPIADFKAPPALLLAYISFIIVNKVFSSFEVRKASVKSSK